MRPVEAATLKQLRSLVAVAKHGTISSAARELHVSPPAVGQQIRLLERAAGVDLVLRTPRGLRLTDAGEQVLATANHIEIEIRSCDDILEGLRTGRTGRVALGAVSTAKYFAPHLLAAFWGDHPDIEVTLRIGNRDETIAALAALDIDVCIMGRPPPTFDLVTHEFGPHPHVVIAHPEHPLVGRHRVRAEGLSSETFLMREEGSGTRALTERMFAALPETPQIGMEIGSNETIKQAVMAGLGLALLSSHTVAPEVADGRLAVLDVVGTPILRSWFVLRHRHAAPTPAMSALWDFVVANGARHLPGGAET